MAGRLGRCLTSVGVQQLFCAALRETLRFDGKTEVTTNAPTSDAGTVFSKALTVQGGIALRETAAGYFQEERARAPLSVLFLMSKKLPSTMLGE